MYIKTSDNIKLYISQIGKGKPCIYIHGGPGGWSYDFEKHMGNSLKEYIQLICFDQRGSGRSEGNNQTDYSIDRITKDIEEIRLKLGLEKCIILAHSFGGIIAINYCNKYANCVEKLILLNSTLNINDSFKSQIEYGKKILPVDINTDDCCSIIDKWKKVSSQLFEKDLFYKLQYDNYNTYKEVNNIGSNININCSMANQAYSNKEYFKSYYAISKQVTCPVLVIIGDKDYAVGIKHYQNFLFPHAKYHIIKGKHILYIEKTYELIKILKEFIK